MDQTNSNANKKEEYSPTDIFSGMIYYMPEEKYLGKRSDMDKVLLKLKQEYALKNNLLDNFDIYAGGFCPIIVNLSQISYGLIISRVVYTDGDGGLIKNEAANKEIEDKILNLFDKKEIKQLQMMAGDYVKILSKYLK